MKKLILATVLVASFSVFANEGSEGEKPKVDPAKKEELKADREAVNGACAADAATAGCGDQKVGKGLLKCIHAYKKEHKKDFKISDGCKDAMKKLKADKKSK